MKLSRTIQISTAVFAATTLFAATPVFAADTVEGGDPGYTAPAENNSAAAAETHVANPSVYPEGLYWDFGIYLPNGLSAQTSLPNWSEFTLPTYINEVKVKGYDYVEGGTTCVFKAGQTIRIESNLALYPVY